MDKTLSLSLVYIEIFQDQCMIDVFYQSKKKKSFGVWRSLCRESLLGFRERTFGFYYAMIMETCITPALGKTVLDEVNSFFVF